MDRGEPVGLLFLDEEQKFLGALNYEGLHSLPLSYVDEDVYEINLGEIKLEERVAEPDVEEMDKIFDVSSEELATLVFANSFFASVANNPDVTGDGKIDFLQGDRYHFGFVFFPGSPKSFLEPEGSKLILEEKEIEINPSYRFQVHFYQEKAEDEVSFYYDDGSKNLEELPYHEEHFSEAGSYSTKPIQGIPKEGYYILQLKDDKEYRFYIPCQSGIKDNFIRIWPEILVEEGKAIETRWEYEAPGTIPLSIENFMASVRTSLGNQGGLTEALPPEQTSYVWEDPVKIDDIDFIVMNYGDIYRNTYAMSYFLLTGEN